MTVTFFGIQGGIQSAQSGNVSFCISYNNTDILFEVSGSPASDLLKAGIDPRQLDAIVITHSHIDHLYALPSLIHNLWLMKRNKKITIISNTATLSMIRKLLSLFDLFTKQGMFEIELLISDESEIPAGCFSLNFFKTKHSVETSGVSVTGDDKKVVYCADSSPMETYPNYISGADGFIHEASGIKENEEVLNRSGHSSGSQAGEIGYRNKAKNLFLCHFPESGDLIDDIRKEAELAFNKKVIIPEIMKPYIL